MYMTRLEDGPLDKSEETFRAVSGLLSLLQCFQGDMHPDFQRDMVSFFCGRFTRLQELRSAPLIMRVSTLTLSLQLSAGLRMLPDGKRASCCVMHVDLVLLNHCQHMTRSNAIALCRPALVQD